MDKKQQGKNIVTSERKWCRKVKKELDWGVPDEYLTEKFLKIAENMKNLWKKIKWKNDESYLVSKVPTRLKIARIAGWEEIEDTEENYKLLNEICELSDDLFDEGEKISKKLIKGGNKITINVQEYDEDYIDEFNKTGYFPNSDIVNPWFVLSNDFDDGEDWWEAFHIYLNRDYYKVIVNG